MARGVQAPNNTMVESDLKLALLSEKATGQLLHRIWRRVRKRLLNGKHINLFVGLAGNKAVNCVRLLKGAESGALALNSIETRPSQIMLARYGEAVNKYQMSLQVAHKSLTATGATWRMTTSTGLFLLHCLGWWQNPL